jgi:branched-subunit amino acid aminotransferase/4-amino-4-deoxychorismate lyase
MPAIQAMADSPGPIAFCDGRWLPAEQVSIPLWDLGFAQGASVVEQCRTYRGRLPLIDRHLNRLRLGIDRLQIGQGVSVESLKSNVEALAAKNLASLAPDSDLGICIVVSAGDHFAFAPECNPRSSSLPRILIHSFPLPFDRWRLEFERGIWLAKTDVREIPAECIPHDFKHRSRLHYFLAQREAEQRHVGSRPLLATIDGYVADAATAGIIAFQPPRWITPDRSQVLDSVTIDEIENLGRDAGIELERRPIRFDELIGLEEIVWCSTPTGLLPVTQLNGKPVGSGKAGPHFRRLAELWTKRVDCDYLGQVLRSKRATSE